MSDFNRYQLRFVFCSLVLLILSPAYDSRGQDQTTPVNQSVSPRPVEIISPLPGSSLHSVVEVTVRTADNIPPSRVRFAVDGVPRHPSEVRGLTLIWDTTRFSNGRHIVEVWDSALEQSPGFEQTKDRRAFSVTNEMEANRHTSIGGILSAIFFAGSIAGLLWWMLHPPAPVQAAVAHAVRGVSAVRRILVPVKGTSYSDRAVELACRLGQDQQAEIILTHVIEVPLALPLSTPLDKEEARAREVVERSSEIVNLHGLKPVQIIERDRDVGRGVLRVANDNDVDLVVLGLNPRRISAGDSVGKSTETILRKSGIEIIIDMVPEDQKGGQ